MRFHPIERPQARTLRRNPTDAEKKLWQALRRRAFDVKFRRQCPLGPYVADFLSYEIRLVIEVDGGQHADSEYDRVRDAWMEAQGYRVLRFWNPDVLRNLDGVLEVIAAHVKELIENTPSQPPPSRGRRVTAIAETVEDDEDWCPV